MNPLFLLVTLSLLSADPPAPKVHDDRLEISLFAIDPQVTTPTGIAVDEKGIVFVVENNTHFRPKEYHRPELDRILTMQDTDSDGRADKIGEFYTGLKNTMSIAFETDGALLVATRNEIFRLRDKDNDGKAEERTDLIALDTKGNYPHNGLAGFALDFRGDIYFGFGENLGAEYTIKGTDGGELKGGGEGGNIYCCDPAGKKLRLVATGFWNPFHVTFDTFGRLFTVDNDPDSRPPCRLIHVVEGGDYGFRFRNGRKGVSPFTAWNGELPATLPMVAGTGEAPCAVMAYESDNFPNEYRGELLVTSWGDHRLERYTLKPRGASFSAEMKPVVSGDQNFRPVGLAMAPDGSLFMSDWVDKSYPIHGKGRIWHLRSKNPPTRQPLSDDPALALAHPHRPWREAAAKKLTRQQVIDVAGNAKDERARVVGMQQVVAKTGSIEKIAPNLGKLSLIKISAGPKQVEEFAISVARYAPKHVADLVQGGELLSRPDIDKLPEAEVAKLSPFVERAIPERAELNRLAMKSELMRALLAFSGAAFVDDLTKRESFLSDPFLQMAAYQATSSNDLAALSFANEDPRAVWEAADIQRRDVPDTRSIAGQMLTWNNPDLRFIGIRWAAESKLSDLAPALEKLLEREADNSRNFAAILVALDRISGRNHENTGEYFAAKFLIGSSKSVPAKIMALRMVSPNHPDLSAKFLVELTKHEDSTLQREAVRALRLRGGDEALARLRETAKDEKQSEALRAEALMALSPTDVGDRQLLFSLVRQQKLRLLQAEATRVLTGVELSEDERRQMILLATSASYIPERPYLNRMILPEIMAGKAPRPSDMAGWQKFLAESDEEPADPQAGERIFFHAKIGACSKCHEYRGRGAKVGPELSTIGKSMTRERLLQSLVDPSREIAPQFTPWVLQCSDGTVKTGVYVGEETDGTVRYSDNEGKIFKLHPRDVDDKKASDKSIMPEGLAAQLTPQELRDLLAFLLR
jgi:putative membrane-bound dehydrogenase-like protein